MLINDYKLEIIWEISCCSQWQSAIARLSENIGQVLPHLASAIKDARYVPAENTLRLVKDSRYIYIYPEKIYILCIENEDEARTLVEWVKDIVNRAYSESTYVTESKRVK